MKQSFFKRFQQLEQFLYVPQTKESSVFKGNPKEREPMELSVTPITLFSKKKNYVYKIISGIPLFLLLFLGTNISLYAQCADTSPTGDCDGDGIANGVDLDDDNDGLLDTDEYDCPVGGSQLVWGTPTWTGGNPGDDFASTAVTTINGTQITADNSATDFGGLTTYSALEGTTFNGKNGLLLQAEIGELDQYPIQYNISFDIPVTGLSFSIVDIDKRVPADASGDSFTDQVIVTISNNGINLPLTSGTDYELLRTMRRVNSFLSLATTR